MLRQGLRSLVEDDSHLQVVGEASNGVEAIDAVRQLRPDVVVMDINMPQMNGIEATRRIKKEFPATAVNGLPVLEGPHIAKGMTEAYSTEYFNPVHAQSQALRRTQTRHECSGPDPASVGAAFQGQEGGLVMSAVESDGQRGVGCFLQRLAHIEEDIHGYPGRNHVCSARRL